ncbi:MAG: sigma-70 family RNA polymerase sigma factor [Mariniphaga sp.]
MKTEKEIIEELRGGVASAFDHLYGAYSHKLYYFSLSILKSKEDAAEVVQNTYLKIWEKRKSIDSSHSFKSFLFTVAYHIAIDLLRERLNERKYRENILHLSYNESAGQLNISVKTVENSLNYTMNFIKARLGKDSLVFLLYAAIFL